MSGTKYSKNTTEIIRKLQDVLSDIHLSTTVLYQRSGSKLSKFHVRYLCCNVSGDIKSFFDDKLYKTNPYKKMKTTDILKRREKLYIDYDALMDVLEIIIGPTATYCPSANSQWVRRGKTIKNRQQIGHREITEQSLNINAEKYYPQTDNIHQLVNIMNTNCAYYLDDHDQLDPYDIEEMLIKENGLDNPELTNEEKMEIAVNIFDHYIDDEDEQLNEDDDLHYHHYPNCE